MSQSARVPPGTVRLPLHVRSARDAGALAAGVPCDVRVAQPMPTPSPDGPLPDYTERFAAQVIPVLRAAVQ